MSEPTPILEIRMAEQWFGGAVDQEDLAAARRMMGMLREDIQVRVAALNPQADGSMAREAHALRGAVGSLGFAACARHLLRIEKEWDDLPASTRAAEIAAANETFRSGLAALLKRYPYLGEPVDGGR